MTHKVARPGSETLVAPTGGPASSVSPPGLDSVPTGGPALGEERCSETQCPWLTPALRMYWVV